MNNLIKEQAVNIAKLCQEALAKSNGKSVSFYSQDLNGADNIYLCKSNQKPILTKNNEFTNDGKMSIRKIDSLKRKNPIFAMTISNGKVNYLDKYIRESGPYDGTMLKHETTIYGDLENLTIKRRDEDIDDDAIDNVFGIDTHFETSLEKHKTEDCSTNFLHDHFAKMKAAEQNAEILNPLRDEFENETLLSKTKNMAKNALKGVWTKIFD